MTSASLAPEQARWRPPLPATCRPRHRTPPTGPAGGSRPAFQLERAAPGGLHRRAALRRASRAARWRRRAKASGPADCRTHRPRRGPRRSARAGRARACSPGPPGVPWRLGYCGDRATRYDRVVPGLRDLQVGRQVVVHRELDLEGIAARHLQLERAADLDCVEALERLLDDHGPTGAPKGLTVKSAACTDRDEGQGHYRGGVWPWRTPPDRLGFAMPEVGLGASRKGCLRS